MIPVSLSSLWPKRIWQQIFVILAAMVVIPLFVLGAILINTSHRAVRTTVMRDHRELAKLAANQVNEFVKKPKEVLIATAAVLGRLQSDLWRQETAVVEFALKYPMFSRVVTIDKTGQEIATSRLGEPLRDRANDPAFEKAMLGEFYVSDMDPGGNAGLISQAGAAAPSVITMAVPVRNAGSVQGVLVADVNLRGIWDIVDNIRIGDTGRAFVVNSRGKPLCYPDKRLVMADREPPYPRAVKDALEGLSGSREEIDQRGGRWIVSYAPVPEAHWALVVYQSAREAYSFSKTMQLQSWLIILVGILITFEISIILAPLMSRPMNSLLEGMRRITNQGDFDTRLEVKREDEIGQLLHSFNAMTEKLKNARQMEKLSSIGRAATAIAHELKNSLVLLNTYAQVLPERARDRNFVEDFAQAVPREIKAWKERLQNIIEFSKVHQFVLEATDVNAIIREIVPMIESRARQNDIEFRVYPGAGLPMVNGNADKLRQVILNLIFNALEATPWGGTIHLSTKGEESHSNGRSASIAVVEVSNTGEGIPPENLGRIFEPFFSTKNGGLGLGLAISREIVERHGGELTVKSEIGKGAVFQVRLPAKGKKPPAGGDGGAAEGSQQQHKSLT